MTAHERHGGVLADIARRNEASRKPVVRHEPRVGIQRLELSAPLGRGPERTAAGNVYFEAAPVSYESFEVFGPIRSRLRGDERQEDVVQLVGDEYVWCRLRPDPLDRGRIESAQLAGLHWQSPAQRYGARAPLTDLGVLVQIGERRPVEDLVGENARLDGVDE